LLASTGTVNLPPKKDGTVRIWDAETGQQLALFETSGVRQLAFSADSSMLAAGTGGDPLQVIVWDVMSLTEKNILKGVFNAIAFSPDGQLVAAGSRDNFVHIIDISTGQETESFAGHKGWVEATTFSPSGELLATGSDDATIQLWHTETGNKPHALKGHTGGIDLLSFSTDERVLASLGSGTKISRIGDQISLSVGPSDQVVRFWNVETGEELARLEGVDGISSISFSADWTRIVTGDGNGHIKLWRISN
jgi:WD40 repeat protein